MSLRVPISCNFIFGVIGFVLFEGCIPAGQEMVQAPDRNSTTYNNSYTISQQKAPPQVIQSVQLHPVGLPTDPPVIRLNSDQKLVLSFDYMDKQSKQFRMEFTHFNADWEKSSLSPSQYLKGFDYTYLQPVEQSFSRRPAYQHIEYEFPNEEIGPAVSGNFLLQVYDDDQGKLLFSLPFFVAEEAGILETEIEQVFAQRNDRRSLDQLFGTYRYPDFVEMPRFELSFYFTQNQFWGRTRRTRNFDLSTPSRVSFYLSRDNAFVGDYDFKFLDLQTFQPDGLRILEYLPETIPPQIILQRDVLLPGSTPRLLAESVIGIPNNNRNSEYAEVHFSLELPDSKDTGSGIYIVGHFNNWMISDRNRMIYNPETKLWEGEALIKQGEYAYKYVKLTDDGIIDDLSLDDSFVSTSREYTTLVYYRDQDQYYDRLLKVGHIRYPQR